MMPSYRSALCVVLLSVLLAVSVHSTAVRNCPGKSHGEMLHVDISSCEKAPCILKKNTTADITIRFKPQEDVEKLKNKVFARIAGIPLPFVGVDNVPSCKNVFETDGETQAGCPLRAGQEYVYKNSFGIMTYYPTVNPQVHWGLVDAMTNKYVVCFEIQAKIVPNNQPRTLE